MNQVKIGKFIAERRKLVNLTQAQLADMLNITDRAVSKWETGKSLPDASIMLKLCGILKITVNDLLSGEVVNMKDNNKEMENRLIELVKQKQEADKRLLSLEIFVGVMVSAILFTLVFLASFVQMATWLRIFLIAVGFVLFIVGCAYALKIEQVAGYYECAECGHRYVPTYNSVLLAMHAGRTRYMKCPKCQRKSWQKKVISKEE